MRKFPGRTARLRPPWCFLSVDFVMHLSLFQSFRHSVLTALIVCPALGMMTGASGRAGEISRLQYETEPPKLRQVELTITDQHGQPIRGATVIPVSMMSKDAQYYWRRDDAELMPVSVSDQRGRARCLVPTHLPDQSRILAAQWSVGHEQYVSTAVEARSAQDSVRCQMKPGRRIAVSVTDSQTGHRITSDLFATLSGPQAAADRWTLKKSGIMVSNGVDPDRQTLRIIHLPREGTVRFSAAIDLRGFVDRPRILLREIEVRPGTRIEGRLDPQVPRPVQNGIVSAFVVVGKNEWHDMADIRPDGTFRFDDMPPGEVAQLTASCDEWTSSDPTLDELNAVGMQEKASRLQRSRVYPQVVRLDGKVIHPVIRMERATTCRVTVVDLKGHPIEGAHVRLIPYQGSFDGRSHVFGHGESTRRRLLADTTFVPTALRVQQGITRDVRSRFTARTSEDGIAEITSLPGGPEGSPAMTSFVVSHPDFFGASNGGLGDQGSSRAALYSGQVTEVTVRMKAR